MYRILTEMGFDAVIHGNKDEDFFNNPVIEKIRTIRKSLQKHPLLSN